MDTIKITVEVRKPAGAYVMSAFSTFTQEQGADVVTVELLANLLGAAAEYTAPRLDVREAELVRELSADA